MNTRRPSCGSARRTNNLWSVIVLIQRSAVVAGTAAAMFDPWIQEQADVGVGGLPIDAAGLLVIGNGRDRARSGIAPAVPQDQPAAVRRETAQVGIGRFIIPGEGTGARERHIGGCKRCHVDVSRAEQLAATLADLDVEPDDVTGPAGP